MAGDWQPNGITHSVITVVLMSRRTLHGGDGTLFCPLSRASAIDSPAMKVYRRAFADEPSHLRVSHKDRVLFDLAQGGLPPIRRWQCRRAKPAGKTQPKRLCSSDGALPLMDLQCVKC
jgi:hypothetical protein